MLNRNIGEVLIQAELGNTELALSRLRATERVLREQFPAVPANAAEATEAVPVGGPYHARARVSWPWWAR